MFRNYVIRNFPFLEDDFDALTDYQLFCKMVGYMKKALIKIDDFQKKLDEFEHYFDNLDVQEEINNKLEEMATSGQLEEIIALFLAYSNILGFDTVSDMQESTSLVNGSICKCLGNTDYLMGDGCYYKIRTKTEDDIIDNYNILPVADDTLVAERIIANVNNKCMLDDKVQAIFKQDFGLFDEEGWSTSGILLYHDGDDIKGLCIANDWTSGGSGGTKFNIVTFTYNSNTVSDIATRYELVDGHANSICQLDESHAFICAIDHNYIYNLDSNTYTEVNGFSNVVAVSDYKGKIYMIKSKVLYEYTYSNNNFTLIDSYDLEDIDNSIETLQGMVIYNDLLILPSMTPAKLVIYDINTKKLLKTQEFTAPYIVEYEDGIVFDNELYIFDTLCRMFTPDIYSKYAIGSYGSNSVVKSLSDIVLYDDPIELDTSNTNEIKFDKYMLFSSNPSNIGTLGSQLESITIYLGLRNFPSSTWVHLLNPIELPCFKNVLINGESIGNISRTFSATYSEDYSYASSFEERTINVQCAFSGGDTSPTLEINVGNRGIVKYYNYSDEEYTVGSIKGESTDFQVYLLKVVGHRKVGINL